MRIGVLITSLVVVMLAGCGESEEKRLAREIDAIRLKITEIGVPPTTEQQTWLKPACTYMQEREDQEARLIRGKPDRSFVQRPPMPQCQWLAANADGFGRQ